MEVKHTIRRFEADDLELVMFAWRRANALAHPFLSQAYVARAEEEVRNIYIPAAETYVLEEAHAVIGFIALLGSEIGGLFLDPSKHGKGYGKALVDHAFALKGPLTVEVFRDNEIGRRFYERYGFTPVSQAPHPPTGMMICRMAMQDRQDAVAP
jgi:putative acetyltransferase